MNIGSSWNKKLSDFMLPILGRMDQGSLIVAILNINDSSSLDELFCDPFVIITCWMDKGRFTVNVY